MPLPLQVAIIQHNPIVGDISGNYRQLERGYLKASEAGAELAITPELALLGYPPRDLLHRHSILNAEQTALGDLQDLTTDGPPLVVGHTARSTQGNGPPLTNCATAFVDGEVAVQYEKRLLPTYDIFDEHRYFSRGNNSQTFEVDGHTIGLTICEDAWYDHEVTNQQRHDVNPIAPYEGVDLLVNLSASPYRINKPSARVKRFGRHAREISAPVAFANQVGGNDDILFDGTSFVLEADGTIQVSAPLGEPQVLLNTSGQDSRNSHLADEVTQFRRMLALGIRDYVDKTGFDEVVIGLSGGIDSSVTAAIAAEAIGPENVYGITLPSGVTAVENRRDAKRVARNLQIRFNEAGIEQLSQTAVESVTSLSGEKSTKGVTRENVQARIRGVLLMGVANELDALVLTPDNKSETAVGYCTLYGDAVGAIAPLGDCTKNRVYALAENYNSNLPTWVDSPPIPRSVIEKPPTAELAEGQIDQDDIPPYEIIDEVVKRYVGDKQSVKEIIVETGIAKSQVQTVIRRLTQSEFKRLQTPPALRVTTKAFDSGWRYPIAASYAEITSKRSR